jgi:hypothetical protein
MNLDKINLVGDRLIQFLLRFYDSRSQNSLPSRCPVGRSRACPVGFPPGGGGGLGAPGALGGGGGGAPPPEWEEEED